LFASNAVHRREGNHGRKSTSGNVGSPGPDPTASPEAAGGDRRRPTL
jgi:hypothetical protein